MDELTSILTTLLETFTEFRKCSGQSTLKKFVFSSDFLFFKRSFGRVGFSFEKLDEKCLSKVGCYLSMSQKDLKPDLFEFFFKIVIWTRRMKYRHDNTAENCLLEVWKLFDRSGKRITELQFLKNLLSSKNLAGLVAIDFANPADKYLPMSGNYPFQFCSNIGHFLSKMKNLWKVPLDK